MEQKGHFHKNLECWQVSLSASENVFSHWVNAVETPVYMNTRSECGHNDAHKPINTNITYILDS